MDSGTGYRETGVGNCRGRHTRIKRPRLIDARFARRFILHMIAICPQHTMTHPRIAGEIYNRYTLQSQRPRRQQVEPAVPREVVDPRRCFEEDDWRAHRLRGALHHLPRHIGNLQVIQPSDESAFNALREKILEPANHCSLLSNICSLFPLTTHYSSRTPISRANPRPHPGTTSYVPR